MDSQGLSAIELRVVTAIVGAFVLLLIYIFGKPKKAGQGKRTLLKKGEVGRIEPTLHAQDDEGPVASKPSSQMETGENFLAEPSQPAKNPEQRTLAIGTRAAQAVERIVTLFVAARAGKTIAGADLIVAMEKAGLQFGDLGIFHRLIVGKPEAGPVFSVANMTKPGNFDMSRVESLATPGVTFFMTLPGPLTALDAWDAMLPSAQRLAELLDSQLLDDERNALGRQRIAHIRDELRAYDRKQTRQQIKPNW